MLYIIVTYNGAEYIQKCLDSIKFHDPHSEIWVHDNGSSDCTLDILKNNGIKLSRASENLGFGAANNLGLKYFLNSSHDACFLLNQDAYLTKSTTKAFSLLSQSKPCILAPLQISKCERFFDPYFKESYLTQKNCPNFHEDTYFQRIQKQYPIAFAPAAAWIIPRPIIETIGGFNPCFFHYGEDRDYINRCAYHGFEILLTGHSTVIHDRQPLTRLSPYKTKKQSHERELLIQLCNPANKGSGFKSLIYASLNFINSYPLKVSQVKQAIKSRRFSQQIGHTYIQ